MRAALVVLALSACTNGAAVPFTVMEYNVAQLGPGPAGAAVVGDIQRNHPDFLAASECTSCDWIAHETGLTIAAGGAADVGLAYDATHWKLVAQGEFDVGNDDDGWGQRVTDWGRFEQGGFGVYVYATHWCVTVRSATDACDAQKQLEYVATTLDQIDHRGHPEDPVVFAGDLNVFDGFEDGPVIAAIEDGNLEDVAQDGTTFQGNTWAPAGDIDYVFASKPVTVLSRVNDTSVPRGTGSDHYAQVVRLDF